MCMVGNRKSLGDGLRRAIQEVTRPAEELARCIREGLIALRDK